MKHRPKRIAVALSMLTVLTLGTLIAGCGDEEVSPAPADTEATASADDVVTERDYPNKEMWWDGLPNMYSIVGINGSEGFDIASFVNTEMAEKLLALQYDTAVRYKDDLDPELVAFWDGLGIKKELHDAEDPTMAWATYTPVAALASDNTAKYPVVFSFHGNTNTILHAEGFGFPHLGATEGFITVIPDADNSDGPTAAKMIPMILDTMEAEGYPIDRSRVYLTGMSKGGICSAEAALALPDVVTAIAIHGSAFALETEPKSLREDLPPIGIPPAAYDDAMAYEIPLYLAVGEYDYGQIPIASQSIIDGFNIWLEMNGCLTRLDLDECLTASAEGEDPVAQMLGVTADETYTETIDDSLHYFADYKDGEGVTMLRFIGIANHPHWTTASYPQMAWDFMSRFSKDSEGLLTVTE